MKVDRQIHTLLPTDVMIGDRQRQDLGDLSELKDSIAEVGQIQPIVVERIGSEYHLIAGHRRLESCRELETYVDAVFWDELNPYERAKVELDENP